MIFEAILLLFWLIAAWIIRLWAAEWGKPPLPFSSRRSS
jgi:hypothetical protein